MLEELLDIYVVVVACVTWMQIRSTAHLKKSMLYCFRRLLQRFCAYVTCNDDNFELRQIFSKMLKILRSGYAIPRPSLFAVAKRTIITDLSLEDEKAQFPSPPRRALLYLPGKKKKLLLSLYTLSTRSCYPSSYATSPACELLCWRWCNEGL